MTGPVIRDVEAGDADAWHGLWAQYLAFYGTDLSPDITAATWARLLSPASRLSCRIALQDRELRGLALWHRHEASWSLRDDCYLEDLFVDPAARGCGIGRALIADLMVQARAAGCGRIYWLTDLHNSRARALYDSFAAADGHIRYRLALQEE